jgi:DNA-directed RNA polymerase subunit RPC12/RpoP
LAFIKERTPALDFESGDDYVYNVFEALIDVVHGEKTKKLQMAKCLKCGRLNSFRPKSKSMQLIALYCKHCGSMISFGIRGKDPKFGESAEIFCENCEDDCRKCHINKLANENLHKRR